MKKTMRVVSVPQKLFKKYKIVISVPIMMLRLIKARIRSKIKRNKRLIRKLKTRNKLLIESQLPR